VRSGLRRCMDAKRRRLMVAVGEPGDLEACT
jgi:hypothetical protein